MSRLRELRDHGLFALFQVCIFVVPLVLIVGMIMLLASMFSNTEGGKSLDRRANHFLDSTFPDPEETP